MKYLAMFAFMIPLLASAKTQGFDHCFDAAAEKYSLDARILRAIAHTESSMRPNVIGPPNKNGTYDIGLMQINTMHLPVLAKHGISEKRLMDACTNIYVGAWVLAKKIARYGYTWNAVGAYNAGNPALRVKYVHKIQRALAKYP